MHRGQRRPRDQMIVQYWTSHQIKWKWVLTLLFTREPVKFPPLRYNLRPHDLFENSRRCSL